MESPHILFVCTTCASQYQDRQKIGESGGERLIAQLENAMQSWELASEFSLQPVQCLSTCSHACAIAFMAEEKPTYLFGDLPIAETQITSTATTVLDCAAQYHAHPEGLLTYKERPELLKNKVMARIPPLPKPVKTTTPESHATQK
jgi:predicted metal-binding protein